MASEVSGRVDARGHLSPAVPTSSPSRSSLADESGSIELSPELRADLLDLDAWGEILTTYGRTMRVAVALTDAQGHVLGQCHNAQPVWTLVHDAAPGWPSGCPFCITTGPPCTAVAEALQGGGAVMARDQAGLAHMAVPLLLGKEPLGAIIAGQVFDRYPELLPLQRVARKFGISAQELWNVARKQRPVSGAVLQASGDLLCALGQAFLRQRYGAILEAKLAETNGRFRLLVEGVRDYALFTMDPTGRVTSWNSGAERMLGYREAEIVGRNFSCIFTPEDIQSCVPEKQLHKALQAGRAQDDGWRVRGNQEQFWANVNITAFLEDAGPVRSFAIIVQDATERRKITIVLEASRQERAGLQEKFLSHVSHELRTPLTAIYLFTTNLLDGLLGELTPDQHEHLMLVLDNINQLKSMVSDLLDITRVENHKLTVEPQPVSPVNLIAEVLSTCRKNAEVKHIRLCSSVAPGLPFIWADRARVLQILINLIDNGIKFTPENGTVTVESRPFAGDRGFLCLSVSDTGCGISPENREIIFDRLAQIGNSAEASRSGLGLGLFITKQLVSQHGGRIWVESQPGRGSTFFFTLPVFSLAKLCAHMFTEPNLTAGSVTLIAVDVAAVEGAAQADVRPEIRKVLERCIQAGQDVLLPSMRDADAVKTFFIVACTDANGFKVIASRIGRELQNFDNISKLKPVISSTTLPMPPGRSREEQTAEVTARIGQLVEAHLAGKESVK
jgi:PAS domain S-box-containing protein